MKSNKKFFMKIIKIIARNCQQITFVTLNGCCSLSEPTPTPPTPPHTHTHTWPLFLTNNGKMDRIPTKIKWKIHTSFTLYFKFWRYFLQKFVRYNYDIFLFWLGFTSTGIIFLTFLELHSTMSEKNIFITNFSFIMVFLRFPPPPPPPRPPPLRHLLSLLTTKIR